MPGMKRRYAPRYKTAGLKHVTGFLTAEEKAKLKKLADEADKSLTNYVSGLLRRHIRLIHTVHKHCPLLRANALDE